MSENDVMRGAALVALFVVAVAHPAGAQPSLTFSVSQILHGEIVHVTGTGFTPRGAILSHLIRPDGTEYPETAMTADATGNITHDITIVPNTYGTYELELDDVATKRSATQRFLMVPRDYGKAVTSTAGRLPASFEGVWDGQMSGAMAGATSPALIALTQGRIGAVVGTVSYEARDCGGELWLISVAGDEVQLGEVIRYGQERCNDRAVLTLSPTRDGSLAAEWRDITRAGTARGLLKKRSE
jgi:hypothetical protein